MLFLLLGAFAYMAGTPQYQGGALSDTPVEAIESSSVTVTDEPQSLDEVINQGESGLSSQLVLLDTSNDSSRILVGSQVVFSDGDESWQIIEEVGLAGHGVVVKTTSKIEGDVFDIRMISLDGSGSSELLFEGVASSDRPALNSAADQIALISFDNAERTFGFRLYSLGINGVATDIDQNPTSLKLPVWRSDEELFYVVNSSEQGQIIKLATFGLGAIDFAVVPSGEQVTALAWDGEKIFYATHADVGRLYSFDFSDSDARLVADNLPEIDKVVAGQDLLIEGDGKISQVVDGHLQELSSEGILIGVRN